MTQSIKGSGSRPYDTTIPALSDNADIVTALKLYHYGSDDDAAAVVDPSIAHWLGTKMNVTDVDAKGDILVGTGDNAVAKVSFPGGVTSGYYLVTDTSVTSTGVKWEQPEARSNEIYLIMGVF